MKFLLPHSFRKIGIVLLPVGFLAWAGLQRGYFDTMLESLFGTRTGPGTPAHLAFVCIAAAGFFMFLCGCFFIAMSKEKIEDEMIQRVRLESFQFAAIVQSLVLFTAFVLFLLFGEPEKEAMLLFFVSLLILFWATFVARFQFVLHRSAGIPS